MNRYNTIQVTNVEDYKEIIIEFWRKYLNESHLQRFDWMSGTNPAGKTIWFLSFTEDLTELVGVLSLLRKNIYYNSKLFKGAIMGDFMVHEKHRVFGPAFSLLKKAVSCVENNHLDFIYTSPNDDSEKIVARAGFNKLITMNTYVKPLRVSSYLKKKNFNRYFTLLISLITENILKFSSKEAYILKSGNCTEISNLDSSFEMLWNNYYKITETAIGVHNAEYLTWRYTNNHSQNYRIIAFNEGVNNDISGYIVFTIKGKEKKLLIMDIVSLNDKSANQLLKHLIKVARLEKCQAVYFTVSHNSRWQRLIKKFNFFDAQDPFKINFINNKRIDLYKMVFFSGDRNI
jgi:hypothetical protein